MNSLIWLHEDALRYDHPVFDKAGENSHTCYIWDADYLQSMDYGFKRLCFIYEAVCDLPVTIYSGNTVDVLGKLVSVKQATQLLVPTTPNPRLGSIITKLSEKMQVHTVEDIAFVKTKSNADIRRFFRYWNKTKKLAMQIDGKNA